MNHPYENVSSNEEAINAKDDSVTAHNVTSKTTSPQIKEVTQELLKSGYLEESSKPNLFRNAILREQEIKVALEPLDLALQLDTHRGIAFLKVAETAYDQSDEQDEWSHPLVRRQRLTLEQSLLIAILRRAFLNHEQESGVGDSPAKIAVDELMPQFLTYFEDSGSDNHNEKRLANLLENLKLYGIVSEVDKNQEITIRPLIVHLANPESLSALTDALKDKAHFQNTGEKITNAS